MPTPLDAFLSRWQPAGGAERANYALFLSELCTLLNVDPPNPAQPDESKNTYVFDRRITVAHQGGADGTTSPNYIDLYKRHHFVLETKQGIDAHPEGTRSVSAGPSPAPHEGTPPAQAATDVPPTSPRPSKRGHGIRGSKLWDDSLLRAKSQAEAYVRNIPDDTPPSSSSSAHQNPLVPVA